MTSPPGAGRARLGVSLMFFTNGVLLAALLPRFPEIKAGLGLSNSAFGLAVVAPAVGALLAAAFAGAVVRRVGTLRLTAVGSLALAAAFVLAGWAPSTWVFVAGLAVAGAVDALVDAAQNVQGVLVEEWRGRSTINSLHALWSLGAATGGVVGATAAAQGVDVVLQMAVNGAVWGAVAVLASVLARVPASVTATTGAAPDDGVPPARPSRAVWRLLLPIVVLAVCGTLVEDVANNWAVLFLDRETAAPIGLAGLGVSVVIGAQFVGRLVGDPMTDRFGRDRVARAGGVLIAAGALLAAASPSYVLVLVGFATMGFGSATLVPAAFAAAGRVPGLKEGTGIALLGWLMRIGFLVTSPVVGVVSDLSSLRVAWLVPAAAGVLAVVLAHRTMTSRSGPRGA